MSRAVADGRIGCNLERERRASELIVQPATNLCDEAFCCLQSQLSFPAQLRCTMGTAKRQRRGTGPGQHRQCSAQFPVAGIRFVCRDVPGRRRYFW